MNSYLASKNIKVLTKQELVQKHQEKQLAHVKSLIANTRGFARIYLEEAITDAIQKGKSSIVYEFGTYLESSPVGIPVSPVEIYQQVLTDLSQPGNLLENLRWEIRGGAWVWWYGARVIPVKIWLQPIKHLK